MSGTFTVVSTYPPEKRELPDRLHRMLTEKRKARKNWQQYPASSMKTVFKETQAKLKRELAEYLESPETWCRRHRQQLPPNYPHFVVENPSNWASKEIAKTCFGRIVSPDEIRFTQCSAEEYRDLLQHLQRMKEMRPRFKYYVYPQARPSSGVPAYDATNDTAKYPEIIVRGSPDWHVHLEAIKAEFGENACSEACGDGIRFKPRDGDEYHVVVGYFKRIKVTEPGLRCFICPLKVAIRGLPRGKTMDNIKEAVAKRGYAVERARQCSRVCYIKMFGGEDNTSILDMTSLFGLNITVELWRDRQGSEESRKTGESSEDSRNTVADTTPATPVICEKLLADFVTQLTQAIVSATESVLRQGIN